MKKQDLTRIIREEIQNVIRETQSEQQPTYAYKLNPKTSKFEVFKTKNGATVTSFGTEDQASKHVDKINKLDKGYSKIKGKVQEGPGMEDMGAYRRMVITSPMIGKIKDEFNKFMSRSDVKSMYPVSYKVIDSPKPETIVVDVEGDKATVVQIKLADILKRVDKAAKVIIRKEKKLSAAA